PQRQVHLRLREQFHCLGALAVGRGYAPDGFCPASRPPVTVHALHRVMSMRRGVGDVAPTYGGISGAAQEREWTGGTMSPPDDRTRADDSTARRTHADVRLPRIPARSGRTPARDRKSTRLNSSHVKISYA